MAVEIVCPFCGFTKETPENAIPERAKWAVCPRCREKFEITLPGGAAGTINASPPADRPDVASGGIHAAGRAGAPWEQRSGMGFVHGAWQTFSEVLFSPGCFFRGLAHDAGMREPFAFGLLAGAVGGMLNLFWPVVLISGGLLPIESSMFTDLGIGLIFLILAVLIPISVAIGMFVTSAVLHLLLLIVRAGGSGFEATFRVVAYSQAAQAWEVIPIIGSLIGGVWRVVVWVIGLREIHGASYARVIVAFLLPAAVVTLLLIAVLVPALILLVR